MQKWWTSLAMIFLIFYTAASVGLCATSTYVCDGLDALGYEGCAEWDNPFVHGWDSDTEFSAGDYTSVSEDDNNYVQDEGNGPGETNYRYYHIFDFTITEDVSDITQIDITWKGVGGEYVFGGPVMPSFPGDILVRTTQGMVSFEALYSRYSGHEEDMPGIWYMQDGAVYPGRIQKVWRYPYTGDMVKLFLSNGEHVKATPHHQFLMDGVTDEYVMAGDLQVGDILVADSDEEIRVQQIEKYPFDGFVYDLTIDEFHNYFLAAGMCVHNSLLLDSYGHSLWVKESGTWQEKDNGTGTSKETLTVQYTTGFSNIISGGHLFVGAISDQEAGGMVVGPASVINTYYVEVLVTHADAGSASTQTFMIRSSGFRVNKGTTVLIRR